MIFPKNKSEILPFLSIIYFYRKFRKKVLAGAHKKFYRIQHPEIYLLDLKVQYKHKMKLPVDMVSKHVFLYLCLPPDYQFSLMRQFLFFRQFLKLLATSNACILVNIARKMQCDISKSKLILCE